MGKEKTIRGTKPTLLQRKILQKNKLNPENFMFIKEIVKHEESDSYNSKNRKSLNRTDLKVRYLQFVDKTTNQVIEIKWN